MFASDKLGIEVVLNPENRPISLGLSRPSIAQMPPVAENSSLIARERQSVSCANSIQGRRSAFAPHLSSIGARTNVETTVQSILEPSATITENFHLQLTESRNQTSLDAVLAERAQKWPSFAKTVSRSESELSITSPQFLMPRDVSPYHSRRECLHWQRHSKQCC
ncbi:MAG: hypothetical protein M2R45_02469 [Verrucomicrobia subdivision 3 bacterium]|nr:hypothetical protein [Limisphaerales bacterium]MCS1413257.1 hypothetical protein [Limisphaerales bacterium]